MSYVCPWPSMENDLLRVEAEIRRALSDQRGDLLGQISSYLVQGKGKRLRASMVLLVAHFGNVQDWDDVFRAAAAVELTHLATLVHDDLIDQAALRHGQASVHVRWTPAIAILVGDYLFARAVTLMNLVGHPRASQYLTATITQMSQAEIRQQEEAFMLDLDESQYLTRITRKTASFFASACAIGASLTDRDREFTEKLYQCGERIGIAYQVLDDLSDFTVSSDAIGKPVGNDLCRGTITLPVIYGLHHERWGKPLARLILEKEFDLAQVHNILTECGAFAYTMEFAQARIGEARRILATLPDHPSRHCLDTLTETILARHLSHLMPWNLSDIGKASGDDLEE